MTDCLAQTESKKADRAPTGQLPSLTKDQSRTTSVTLVEPDSVVEVGVDVARDNAGR
ncbi:hypothetical protein AB0D42_26310 [Streptomyces sp. NPDC048304]|uniref:hypothetical protein n=1 Tax=Streptomyces sp. NPDC048304 TaxID=3154820 RepID=UPI0033F9F5E1